jgi:apolipoprotein N-acyltransferase
MTINDNWSNAALAAVSTGILYALSLDIGPFGPLALIAPIPLLLFALGSARASHVAFAAILARFIGATGVFYAYGSTLPLSTLALMSALFASLFTLIVLLTWWSARRLPTWMSVLTFPLLATALEFLFLFGSPDGSFGAMGYSIVGMLPLAQLASIGGAAALTFVVTLVPMTITVVLHRRSEWRQAALAGAIPILLVCAFGIWRLSQPYEQSVRVGLASIDALTMRALKGPAEAADVAERYAALVQSFAPDDLDLVVLPERVFADREGQLGVGSRPLQAAAEAIDASVVAGFDEVLADGRHANTARVFTPEGALHRYAKRRMIPGLESHLVPGDGPLLIGDLGVAICKDLDFPPMIREYGERGATLMLVPAWDFKIDGRMHSRMAVLRSIENGFAMVRAAASGRLTVNDAHGRIIAEKITSDVEPVKLVSELGLTSSARTLYSSIGDVFAWLTVCGAVIVLSASARARRSRA